MSSTEQNKISRVMQYLPEDGNSALLFFNSKLCYETDSYDVFTDLQDGIENIVVVDVRSELAYAREHIPGAINIPHRSMNSKTTGYLDKSKVYIAYCDGIGCNGSTKGAAKLTALGFITKELIGGIEWWKRDGYPVESGNSGQNIDCGC
jgi:rhodanese-related sulfurtransferase